MAGPVAPDRRRVSSMRLWAMAALTGVMIWTSLGSLPRSGQGAGTGLMTQASILVAVLAIFGLRSVPVRRVILGMALVTGLMLARFGQLSATEGLTGSWRVLVWLAAMGAALVLAPSSRSVVVDVGPRAVDADATRTRAIEINAETRARIPRMILVASVSLVVGSALLFGPRVANWFPVGSTAGDLVDRGGDRSGNVLSARDSLDMTSRPRLSDKVVMTVRSPIVSFWRAELFDTWDGSTWTRSYGRAGSILIDGRTTPLPDDIAALDGRESTQEFYLETGFATVLPSAPSPVKVDSAVDIAQRVDGSLVTPYRAVGRGTRYTVTSRQMPLDQQVLRAERSAADRASDDAVAMAVVAQYAQDPVATERVTDLARRVTAGASNDYDRILALEQWMGDNTEYSLDAPLSPKGVDVVDDFLFESREGWCEQIASSLVVMARSVGIPARLATGYAPGEWDAVGGRFVVRELDAHAWAEVWFPDSGWVPFDPTASVPLSGTDEAAAGATARDWREVLGALLLVVGIIAVAWAPLMRMVARVFESLRRRRSERREIAERWEVRAEKALERLGEQAGRPRVASDSLTSYGQDVARKVGEESLAEVGVILDRVTYAGDRSSVTAAVGPADGPGGDAGDRQRVEAILAGVSASVRNPVEESLDG